MKDIKNCTRNNQNKPSLRYTSVEFKIRKKNATSIHVPLKEQKSRWPHSPHCSMSEENRIITRVLRGKDL